MNGGPLTPIAHCPEEIGDPGFPDPAGSPRWKASKLIVTGGTQDWRELHTTMEQTPESADKSVLEIGLLAKSKSGKGSTSRELAVRWPPGQLEVQIGAHSCQGELE